MGFSKDFGEWFKPAELSGYDDAQLAAQHQKLQAHMRWMQIGVTCTVLLLIAIFLIASKARVAAIPGDQVASELERRANIVVPKLTTAAGEVAEEVAPVLGEALGKEAASAIEDMQHRMDKEMADLERTLETRVGEAFDREIDKAGTDGAKMLEEAFPQLKGNPGKTKQITQGFHDAMGMWAQKQLVTTFKKHIDAMFKIKDTLNAMVKVAQPPKGAQVAGADAPVAHKIQPERLLELWIELVSDALGGYDEEGDLLAPDPAPVKI